MAFDQATRRTVFELDNFPKYPGLLIKVRKPSFGGMLLLARAEKQLGVGLVGATMAGVDRIEVWQWVIDAFAESLIGWTLFDEGLPVPPTADGVFAQDHTFVLELAHTWYRRVVMMPDRVAESIGHTPPPDDTPDDDPEDDSDEDALASLPVTTLPAPEPAAEAVAS